MEQVLQGREQGDHRRQGRAATAWCPTCRCPSCERRAREPRPDSRRRSSTARREQRNEPALSACSRVGGVASSCCSCCSTRLFTVHQTQQALVLQFGNPVRVDPGAGPALQDAVRPAGRSISTSGVLDFDAPRSSSCWATRSGWWSTPSPATASPTRCASASRSAPRRRFRGRLEPIVVLEPAQRPGRGAAVHDPVAGPHPAHEPHPAARPTSRWPGFGVEVVDVRIKRADLPPENSQAIFRAHADRARARGQGAARPGRRGRRSASAPAPIASARVLIAEAQRQVADPARPGRCRGDPHLRRGVRAGPGVLRLLPLAAGLSRGAGRRLHQLRAVAGQRVLPVLQRSGGERAGGARGPGRGSRRGGRHRSRRQRRRAP